jgi:ABC-2 type transport system permease protein
VTARFILAAWSASLRAALEYRAAFLAQAGFMALNNLLFLAFWGVFFGRFRDVNGWDLSGVARLFAIAATAFGLAVVLAGGLLSLSRRITTGGLDTWLLRPAPVFAQAATSQARVSGMGDIVSGVLLMLVAAEPTPRVLATYVLMSVTGAIALAAFVALLSSLAFVSRGSEEVPMHGLNAVITFALYPPGLFGGVARVVLYVLVPAGLVSHAPTELLHAWSWGKALALWGGVAALVGLAALAWRAGLARYESGNLVQQPHE